MLSHQFRKKFLEFFKKQGHTIVPSSPVIPHNDPTLLFNNAGMNQFKEIFLGKSTYSYSQAASCQKCIRAGGKHNDLENVGHTSRHLTFFEMLGNFSFGNYFKEKAIEFAWNVSVDIFAFEPEKIWVTVFETDDEAFEYWKKYVPEKRILRMGEKSNFWAMGETGPCGPCSELFYDRGDYYSTASSPLEDVTEERYLEFWNLVFMQYNKDTNTSLTPLPKASIDTGAGLERLVSLKMNVHSVFETDILRSIITHIEKICNKKYISENAAQAAPFNVIADHLRTLCFAIADGAQPSNVDRGYVLRKILRRAVRYGKQLGLNRPFLAKLVPTLIESMGPDFEELVQTEKKISEILTMEEEAFLKTLERGGNLLNQAMNVTTKVISGDTAFKLKDTYGLPLEEILLIGKDAGLGVELERFYALEKEAKEKSRQAHSTTKQTVSSTIFEEFLQSHSHAQFVGYNSTNCSTEIIGMIQEERWVSTLEAGDNASILLKSTPFYAEKGGQVGDIGYLESTQGDVFTVTDCQNPYPGIILHIGTLKNGSLQTGKKITAQIEEKRRSLIACNHTATHLLHWALAQVLGEHIRQAGSMVDSDRLRLDFNHHKAISREELKTIETHVNDKIRTNRIVQAYELPYEEAQDRKDIKQFFGDKYDSVVRVIDIDFSKELCGGTHTSQLGNIGFFKIIKESSIAQGVRRIEAVTGKAAELVCERQEHLIEKAAELLKTNPSQLLVRIEKLDEEIHTLHQQIKENALKEIREIKNKLLREQKTMNKRKVICHFFESFYPLKQIAEEILNASSHATIVFLICIEKDRSHLVLAVSSDLTSQGIDAAKMMSKLAPLAEGKGGGKATFAQAGGKKINDFTPIFKQLEQLVSSCE